MKRSPDAVPLVRQHALRGLFLALCMSAGSTGIGGPAVSAGLPWWDDAWRFRAPVEIDPGGYPRQEYPADVLINFTRLLADVGYAGPLNLQSIRVVEIDSAGSVLDDSVDFQFDPDASFHPTTKASGILIVLLDGATPSASPRRFHVYFDLQGRSFTPPVVWQRVDVEDNVMDESQASVKVTTEVAAYYYHKQGGGFSSIVDMGGNDWVGYHPTYQGSTGGGPGRGLPNAVYPRGYFHPGSTSSTSSIVAAGPLKATLSSITVADGWECRWEIYPRFARLTMLSGDSSYWLLYEGTPGGTLDMASDFVVRSNGAQNLVSQSWTEDIAGDEWAYFADPAVRRSLFMAHHTNDGLVDMYADKDGLMTIFGFGRRNISSYLTEFPTSLTIGLVDATDYPSISTAINSAYKDVAVTVGPGEVNLLPGRPVLLSPPDRSTGVSVPVRLEWQSDPLAILYGLQVATDSTFSGSIVRNDSTLVDTTAELTGLLPSTAYYWRVYGRNASGSGSPSVAWRFVTLGQPPPAVTLLTPADSASVGVDSVRFEWSSVPGVFRYWFELGFDSSFVFRILDSSLTDTVKIVPILLDGHEYYWRVRAENDLGWGPFSSVRSVRATVTHTVEPSLFPPSLRLEQNYPNPFNPVTEIRFAIPGRGEVELDVHDVLGRHVGRLLGETINAGTHSVRFDAGGIPGGTYFYTLRSGGGTITRRMLVLK